ncbi:response regulator transcription factor [Vibrio sonorensis]|uniref:response regulator transcription factor n=1 Tax=Vibrio sonorensis TaxID=1004316 RepID=UPI0008DA1965|nr:response regulator [Vibrio sonorensis]
MELLIVDDSKSVLAFAQQLVSQQFADRVNVHLCESGREAESVLDSQPIDLVMTDVFMPEMDGYELTKRIRKKYKDMMVVVMSGGYRQASSDTTLKTASILGADFVIDKSDLEVELTKTLQLFLGVSD